MEFPIVKTKVLANEAFVRHAREAGVVLVTGPSEEDVDAFMNEVSSDPSKWVRVSSSVNGDGYEAISNAKLIYGLTPKIVELFVKKAEALRDSGDKKPAMMFWVNYSRSLTNAKLVNKFAMVAKHLGKVLGLSPDDISDSEAVKAKGYVIVGVTPSGELREALNVKLSSPPGKPNEKNKDEGGGHE
jgi:hypothetical protein